MRRKIIFVLKKHHRAAEVISLVAVAGMWGATAFMFMR